VHRADDVTGTMLFIHNLGEREGTVDLTSLADDAEYPNDVLADREYGDLGKLDAVAVGGYGYRWIRLKRHP
jgi:maltose alpha-D-glucosyltransferase / alpha-amylase